MVFIFKVIIRGYEQPDWTMQRGNHGVLNEPCKEVILRSEMWREWTLQRGNLDTWALKEVITRWSEMGLKWTLQRGNHDVWNWLEWALQKSSWGI